MHVGDVGRYLAVVHDRVRADVAPVEERLHEPRVLGRRRALREVHGPGERPGVRVERDAAAGVGGAREEARELLAGVGQLLPARGEQGRRDLQPQLLGEAHHGALVVQAREHVERRREELRVRLDLAPVPGEIEDLLERGDHPVGGVLAEMRHHVAHELLGRVARRRGDQRAGGEAGVVPGRAPEGVGRVDLVSHAPELADLLDGKRKSTSGDQGSHRSLLPRHSASFVRIRPGVTLLA